MKKKKNIYTRADYINVDDWLTFFGWRDISKIMQIFALKQYKRSKNQRKKSAGSVPINIKLHDQYSLVNLNET